MTLKEPRRCKVVRTQENAREFTINLDAKIWAKEDDAGIMVKYKASPTKAVGRQFTITWEAIANMMRLTSLSESIVRCFTL